MGECQVIAGFINDLSEPETLRFKVLVNGKIIAQAKTRVEAQQTGLRLVGLDPSRIAEFDDEGKEIEHQLTVLKAFRLDKPLRL